MPSSSQQSSRANYNYNDVLGIITYNYFIYAL